MNEGLQKALTDLIARLSNAIDGATVAIPDLVRDLISFQILNTWAWLSLYLLGIVVCLTYIGWFIKAFRQNKHDDWDDILTFCLTIGVIVAIVLLFPLSSCVVDCSTTLVALYHYPNVWVLSYLRGML